MSLPACPFLKWLPQRLLTCSTFPASLPMVYGTGLLWVAPFTPVFTPQKYNLPHFSAKILENQVLPSAYNAGGRSLVLGPLGSGTGVQPSASWVITRGPLALRTFWLSSQARVGCMSSNLEIQDHTLGSVWATQSLYLCKGVQKPPGSPTPLPQALSRCFPSSAKLCSLSHVGAPRGPFRPVGLPPHHVTLLRSHPFAWIGLSLSHYHHHPRPTFVLRSPVST